MSVSTLAKQKFFGLLELDPSGQVLYSRLEKDGIADTSAVDITGRNFFSEVAPFSPTSPSRARTARPPSRE